MRPNTYPIIYKFIMVIICLFVTIAADAQDYYQISYSGSVLSSNITDKLSKEVADPYIRNAFIEAIGEYHSDYSLYVDVTGNRSLFIEEAETSLDGPPPFKFFRAEVIGNDFSFEEFFRSERFQISGQKKEMVWRLTNQTQKINNFTCKKAILENDPFNSIVWYTEDFPLDVGPGIGFGLPGLVVLFENDYFACTINKITKIGSLPKTLNWQLQAKNPRSKTLSINQYHTKVSPMLKTMANEKILN